MKWIGQNIYDLVSKFRNTVDFSEDVTFYQPVNNADPEISIGASDDERLKIEVSYQGTTTQMAQIVSFKTFTESDTAHDGRFVFSVDEANILKIQDAGINLYTGMGISINGTDILTDSSGTATLSNIDALDATTIATLNAALTAGDITGVTAGTGLSGGGTSGAITLNVDAAQSQITSLGTLTGLTLDGNKSVTPGDGAMIHLDANEITDSNTSASGTAAKYTHVSLEPPRLHATNASVTTTDAATLYISGPPSAGTNMTLTNNYSLWVGDGDVQFDVGLNVNGATTLPGLTTIGATGVNTIINSDDIQWYNAVNNGNPQLSIGSSATNRLTIWPTYESGAQTLQFVDFGTYTTSGTALHGYFRFTVDEIVTASIGTTGIDVVANKAFSIAGTNIISDSSGTATLSNIDALDATTTTTIETAMEATQKQFTYHMIKDDIATGVVYIGLNESDAENAAATNKYLPFIAPVAGKLLKIFLRTSTNMSGTNLTWRLYTRTTSATTAGVVAEIGAQTGAGPTNSTMTTYDFTSSLDSGTNAIAVGDKVQISVQSDATSADQVFNITCLWEWDLS